MTNCKHEYHLQCILEWSQRSKECPICWQLLVLKDPASQELLAAMENERSLRSELNTHHIYEEPEIDHDYTNETDFEERIMWNFAAAASRVRSINRRRRQRPSGGAPVQVIPSVPATNVPNVQQVYTSLEEFHSASYASPGVDSLTSSSSSTIINQTPSEIPSTASEVSESVGIRDAITKPSSQSPTDSSRRPSSSEMLRIPESVKSRFSAASARYKESISKSTRGLKEKLLARNSSVKEISRGVQREMNAGIAGVARMIERLELASKRTVPLSNCHVADLNSSKGKDVQEDITLQSHPRNTVEAAHSGSSHVQPLHL